MAVRSARKSNNPFYRRHQANREHGAPAQRPSGGAGRPVEGEVLSPTTPDPWAFPEASGRRYGARSVLGGQSFEAVGGFSRPIVDRPSARSEVRRYAREAQRRRVARIVERARREAQAMASGVWGTPDVAPALRAVARRPSILRYARMAHPVNFLSQVLAEIMLGEALSLFAGQATGGMPSRLSWRPGGDYSLVATWDGRPRYSGVPTFPVNRYVYGAQTNIQALFRQNSLRRDFAWPATSWNLTTPIPASSSTLSTGLRIPPGTSNTQRWYGDYWLRRAAGGAYATNWFPDARMRGRLGRVVGPLAGSDGLPVPEADLDGPPPRPPSDPPYRRRAVLPPSGHLYRPRRGEERKATIRNRGLASRLLKLGESASELQDFIDALYEALPQRVKQRASMELPKVYDWKTGEWKYRQPNPAQKVAIIVANIGDLDLVKAFQNVVQDQVEDYVEGVLGEFSKRVYAETGQLTGTDRAVNLGRGLSMDLPRF